MSAQFLPFNIVSAAEKFYQFVKNNYIPHKMVL